jgi:acyl transferase domain-containing protein
MSVKTVFMFSGQGSQYYQMGKEMYAGHAVFRHWMDDLDERVRRLSGRRVVEAIHGSGKAEVFDRTALTHPAIFMVEYALAQCLVDEGVEPDLVLGASLGSVAAAAVAGYIGVEEALAAVLAQAEAFDATCAGGGMIAVLADPQLYDEPFLRRHADMAGVNFATHFAVSAPDGELGAIEAELKQRGIAHQRLAVTHAYHSRWIDDARGACLAHPLRAGRGLLPFVCCEQAATLDRLPDDFSWRVVRRPIRFRDAIAHIERAGTYRYVDVGPSGTLATFVKYAMPTGSRSTAHAVLTPYGQDRKNLAAVVAAHGAPEPAEAFAYA